MSALWFAIAVLAVASSGLVIRAYRRQSEVRRLVDVAIDAQRPWPRVSVIMAARDEADRIGPALASRLADDYPDLEFVLVDDRSTDTTGDIARLVAGTDPRFRLVDVRELPMGWLGKVHALNEGMKVATGDYLLFSDADVTVEPGAVQQAVALCEREGIDCLGMIPEYRSASALVDAAWVVFLRAFCLALNHKKWGDARYPKDVIGSGAFTLVRREAYERTPGFEHLRMESADDMALAYMIKQSGGKCDGVIGVGAASVAMYDSPTRILARDRKERLDDRRPTLGIDPRRGWLRGHRPDADHCAARRTTVATRNRPGDLRGRLARQHRNAAGYMPHMDARAALAARHTALRHGPGEGNTARRGSGRRQLARYLLQPLGARVRAPVLALDSDWGNVALLMALCVVFIALAFPLVTRRDIRQRG